MSDIVLYELDPNGKFTKHVIDITVDGIAEDGKGKGKGKGFMDQIEQLVEHIGQLANNLPQGKGNGKGQAVSSSSEEEEDNDGKGKGKDKGSGKGKGKDKGFASKGKGN